VLLLLLLLLLLFLLLVLLHMCSCTACPKGKYTAGEAKCIDCPKGSFCTGGIYSTSKPPVNESCPQFMTTLGIRASSARSCGKRAINHSQLSGLPASSKPS
jgi:hypothetical protein